MPFILPEVATKTKPLLIAKRAIYPERRPSCSILPARLACPAGFGLAGAPPDCVLIGPVQPCGCNWPLSSGAARPLAVGAGPGLG
jgi:hypothetical protein